MKKLLLVVLFFAAAPSYSECRYVEPSESGALPSQFLKIAEARCEAINKNENAEAICAKDSQNFNGKKFHLCHWVQ
jgi:hypothetical protein